MASGSFSFSTQAFTSLDEWQALRAGAREARQLRLARLFAEDSGRQADFSLEAAGLWLDYSRHLLTHDHLGLLWDFAKARRLRPAIEALFAGEAVNTTEQRPALHVALRSPDSDSEEEQAVHGTLARMAHFVKDVHAGLWRGFSGSRIRHVVNIGIGGSDLGPAMVCEALRPYLVRELRCHFVSNVDPRHLESCLAELDAADTLFIVASKSFTTRETMENAMAARQWLQAQGVPAEGISRHFVAVSADVSRACEFGIDEDNVFPMWDWVGGRYSLWSAIGLPIALAVGMDRFRELLSGAHVMDRHFREAEVAHNLPVTMALLSFWYRQCFGAETHVVLPYLQDLHLFPAYLQQLDMESLGKSVRHDGSPLDTQSGSILWGSAGTNGQHSFHQLLHQGTSLIPADFIAAARSHGDQQRHDILLANCFAQSQALMTGCSEQQIRKTLEDSGMDTLEASFLARHKATPGNRPSSTLLMEQLTPATLGALLAAYEHKSFTLGILLGVNPFDQWGVELGKVLSVGVEDALQSGDTGQLDASTAGLVQWCRERLGRD